MVDLATFERNFVACVVQAEDKTTRASHIGIYFAVTRTMNLRTLARRQRRHILNAGTRMLCVDWKAVVSDFAKGAAR